MKDWIKPLVETRKKISVSMATNHRKKDREMRDAIRKNLMAPENNLIIEEDVKRIKSLLKLPHRTEDEWTVIKNILCGKNVITMEIESYPAIEHMVLFNGFLTTFTNVDDCFQFVRSLDMKVQRFVKIEYGTIGYFNACRIADDHNMSLAIDLVPNDDGLFLLYGKGRIEAMRILKE